MCDGNWTSSRVAAKNLRTIEWASSSGSKRAMDGPESPRITRLTPVVLEAILGHGVPQPTLEIGVASIRNFRVTGHFFGERRELVHQVEQPLVGIHVPHSLVPQIVIGGGLREGFVDQLQDRAAHSRATLPGSALQAVVQFLFEEDAHAAFHTAYANRRRSLATPASSGRCPLPILRPSNPLETAMPENPAFNTVAYDIPRPYVARITQNRPEARNAQSVEMTYELNAAFDHANQDGDVKVIVLAGAGPHFSSGHDMRGGGRPMSDFKPVGTWGNFAKPGMEGFMAREEEIYLQMCQRWRNIAKPTMAMVQGKCIAGGLMLAWACDIIIASEDASFMDPTVAFGVNGVEYFMHPWELGARKAKEFLFTGDPLSAQEAYAAGMVNRVVPRGELETFTLAMAERIAAKPSFALKVSKLSVNQMLEAQGQPVALSAAMSLQELAHSHNLQVFGQAADPSGIPAAVRPK
jgi:enoyl-CoA hydratase